MTTFKILVNSTLSTPGARWLGRDIKNYYLDTPMDDYEYMFIPLSSIPEEIIMHYKLQDIVHNGKVYMEIHHGMYGLPQAGILAEKQLIRFLGSYGYEPVCHTPGLWRHTWRPISFCLVIDDFGVKYIGKEHADHLIQCLCNHYQKVDIDWDGKRFSSVHLDWDYDKHTCSFNRVSSQSPGLRGSSALFTLLVFFVKIACLHVSFTAYEKFYKLSKMHCLLILTFHFPIFRMSECRNATIKHISAYKLVSSFINTYVTDLFLRSISQSKIPF